MANHSATLLAEVVNVDEDKLDKEVAALARQCLPTIKPEAILALQIYAEALVPEDWQYARK